MIATPNPEEQITPHRRKRRFGLRWLLVLPYLGLIFPGLYARNVPSLWGFPFFYWYQLAWVLLASLIMGLVYRAIRD